VIEATRELGLSTPMFNGSANPTVKTYREAAGKSLEASSMPDSSTMPRRLRS
jgi:hypothetical protein